jgi:Tfp pilus assembly PilM family ATPase
MERRRKLQLYLTESQYQLLKRWAGERGSLAGVVRDLIDQAATPMDAEADPFFQHVMSDKERGGQPYEAQEAKRALNQRPV